MSFRKKAFSISEKEYQDYYQQTGECNLLKGSDLNQQCFDKINQHSVGEALLDVGCDRGELARSLASRFQVTATDLVLNQEVVDRGGAAITWQQGNIEALPFKDQQFDTVFCTHVLEHVIDVQATLV
ncbi:class I SAM-dependent methyltransferase [Pelagibaculum spongiae]|uniref:class I SAM-dependent methyltransferase n=1 Tax=Pelagibaculum spongiae TaxID=2080658 RepID=UPI001314C54D|nr:class I SAM-dependent methyltransferase [Pelagibaculum spongiae]